MRCHVLWHSGNQHPLEAMDGQLLLDTHLELKQLALAE
jgi:hypothetical protein